jgi:hypothetical protein
VILRGLEPPHSFETLLEGIRGDAAWIHDPDDGPHPTERDLVHAIAAAGVPAQLLAPTSR